MRVAVTGSNGFIASHVVSALISEGHEVTCCVRTDTSNKTDHLKKMGERVTIVSGCDLSKPGSYDEAFKGVECVLHTAAVVDISGGPGDVIIEAAVAGSKNVLKSAIEIDSVKRFVLTSSVAAVFQARGKDDDYVYTESDWNEWSTPANDPYGYGKCQAEKYVWDEAKGKLDVVVINPVVVLGPCLIKQHTKSSAALVREIMYGNAMHKYSASYVDVRDVARAHAVAATSDDAVGKRFIVCSDSPPMATTELAEVAAPVCPDVCLVGKPKIIHNPVLWWLAKLTGQVTPYQAANVERKFKFSNAQSKEILKINYHKLEDTLKDTIESMRKDKGGWIPVKTKSERSTVPETKN